MQKEIQKTGKVLLGEGILTREVISSAISEAGLKGTALAALLEKSHHVSAAELAAFLAGDFDIPVIKDLRKFDLFEEAAKSLPASLARKYQILPLVRMGNILCIARADYFDLSGIAEIRSQTGLYLKVFQAEGPQLEVALARMYDKAKTEIPSPRKLPEQETRVIESLTSSVTVDAIPLISSPAPRATKKASPNAVVSPKGLPDPEDEILLVEDSAETSSPVLDAVVVAPHEYGAAQKDHAGEMIRKFEETFLEENVLPAQSL